MRKLVVCLGIVSALAILAETSRADFVINSPVVTTTNIPGPFDGNSGYSQFTILPGAYPFATIKDIEVTVSFSKLRPDINSPPSYNEVSLSFSKIEIPGSVQLINSGSNFPASAGAFNQGITGDLGFNGTITFSMSAPLVVNANEFLIQAGAFKPVDAAGFGLLTNQDVAGTYRLTITDSAAQAPLVFNSFSAKITAVPEPTSLACLGLLATAGAFVRRRRVS